MDSIKGNQSWEKYKKGNIDIDLENILPYLSLDTKHKLYAVR